MCLLSCVSYVRFEQYFPVSSKRLVHLSPLMIMLLWLPCCLFHVSLEVKLFLPAMDIHNWISLVQYVFILFVVIISHLFWLMIYVTAVNYSCVCHLCI